MAKVQPIPEGHEGVIAHLVLDGCAQAIDFYKKAFGAEEVVRMPAPGGKKIAHAELRLGRSVVYLCDDFPEWGQKPRSPKALGGTPVSLHQYVTDVDKVLKRAESAGGTISMQATEMFWGDRFGSVRDAWGHEWTFATHTRDLSPDEIAREQQKFFAQGGGCGEGKGH